MNNCAPTGEQLFSLSDGRTLAYDQKGDPNSSTVIVFFHGAFGTGNCVNMGAYLQSRSVHYVAPTLPGWGDSSSIPAKKPYSKQFVQDFNELLVHLHPHDPNLKLYTCGGSYGTVHVQMLYGAPYDVFPMGKYLRACLLLAPYSPFRYDKDAYKHMTWPTYLMFGPPARTAIPFQPIQRLGKFVVGRKLATVEGSEGMIDEMVFDKMTKDEKEEFRLWCSKTGNDTGEFRKLMAMGLRKSVSKTWDGYFAIADTCAGDWGFDPTALDEEHSKRKIIIIASKQDELAPVELARYLARVYINSQLIEVNGGHIAGTYRLEEEWENLLCE